MNKLQFLCAVIVMFVSSCSKEPAPNYKQAIDSDIVESTGFLSVLNALDAGDAAKARKTGIGIVFLNLGAAQFYQSKNLASFTPDQAEQWNQLAKKTLDYIEKHKDEIDAKRLDVQSGIRGLRFFLKNPKDLQRLEELLKDWERNQDKNSSGRAKN